MKPPKLRWSALGIRIGLVDRKRVVYRKVVGIYMRGGISTHDRKLCCAPSCAPSAQIRFIDLGSGASRTQTPDDVTGFSDSQQAIHCAPTTVLRLIYLLEKYRG